MICTSHDDMISPFMFCGGHELSLYVAFTRKKYKQLSGQESVPDHSQQRGQVWIG